MNFWVLKSDNELCCVVLKNRDMLKCRISVVISYSQEQYLTEFVLTALMLTAHVLPIIRAERAYNINYFLLNRETVTKAVLHAAGSLLHFVAVEPKS